MQYTLTAATVHWYATDILGDHLRLADYKRVCTAEVLLTVVFAACARLTSLFAAALGLRRAPAPETVRKALHANLPDLATLERRLNDALHATRPMRLGRRVRLAIDLTLLSYHGQPWRDRDELYKSRAKSGTTHFHAYATADLVLRGQRFTVALSYVRKGESMAAVVQRLLAVARRIRIRPHVLLLDRGFYAADVIRYLQAARCPFLMPVPIRGRRRSGSASTSAIAAAAAASTAASGWCTPSGGSRLRPRPPSANCTAPASASSRATAK